MSWVSWGRRSSRRAVPPAVVAVVVNSRPAASGDQRHPDRPARPALAAVAGAAARRRPVGGPSARRRRRMCIPPSVPSRRLGPVRAGRAGRREQSRLFGHCVHRPDPIRGLGGPSTTLAVEHYWPWTVAPAPGCQAGRGRHPSGERRAEVAGPQEEGLHPADGRPSDGDGGDRKPSPVWLPITAVALIVFGIAWLVVYYLSEQAVPGRGVGLLEPRGRLRRDGRLAGPALPLALSSEPAASRRRSRRSRAVAPLPGSDRRGAPVWCPQAAWPDCEMTHVTAG